MTIEIISGSPRRGSVTHRVALHLHHALAEAAPAHSVGLISMQEWALPPVQEVWNNPEKAPEQYRPIAERMVAAQALVLVTPEYNGGYSPAMKNFLDHFPKQLRKPFGLATASPGAMGGMRAAQQMLPMVAAFYGIASPTLLIVPAVDKKFAEDGTLLDAAFGKAVHDFSREFLWLAERLAAPVAS